MDTLYQDIVLGEDYDDVDFAWVTQSPQYLLRGFEDNNLFHDMNDFCIITEEFNYFQDYKI